MARIYIAIGTNKEAIVLSYCFNTPAPPPRTRLLHIYSLARAGRERERADIILKFPQDEKSTFVNSFAAFYYIALGGIRCATVKTDI